MNEEIQPGKLAKVVGKILNYHVNKVSNPNDGHEWIALTQTDVTGAQNATVYIDPELLPDVCKVLQSMGGVLSSEPSAKTPRKLPKDCEFLRDRHAGAPWSTGEDALMVHLFLEGYDIADIAIRLGRSYSAITSRLRQRGIPDYVV